MSFQKKRKELLKLWGNDEDAAANIDSKIAQMESICGAGHKMKIVECLTQSDLNIEQAIALFFS